MKENFYELFLDAYMSGEAVAYLLFKKYTVTWLFFFRNN